MADRPGGSGVMHDAWHGGQAQWQRHGAWTRTGGGSAVHVKGDQTGDLYPYSDMVRVTVVGIKVVVVINAWSHRLGCGLTIWGVWSQCGLTWDVPQLPKRIQTVGAEQQEA